jgi:hypothetical protein
MRFLPMVLPFSVSAVPACTATTDESGDSREMGTSWQEHTFELGALVVETAGVTIRSIRHIARRDVASLNNERAGGTTHVELLCPSEFIRRVEYRYTPQDGVVGIRVRTTRRTSQWIGAVRGLVNAVDAPHGFFINTIVGIHNKDRCWPLGALSCPLSMIAKPEAADRRHSRSLAYGAGLHDGLQRAFQESALDVRAIVVQCDLHIMRVWVLSAIEYDQFEVFRSRAPLGRNEFCLELVQGEVIERVDIQSHKVVNAIRIHTSQRETPWWGRAAFGSIVSIDCRRDQRAFAGFYGTTGNHFVGSLGVVFGEGEMSWNIRSVSP